MPKPALCLHQVSTICRSPRRSIDCIAATPETIPVPDWHREILDETLKDLQADRTPVISGRLFKNGSAKSSIVV